MPFVGVMRRVPPEMDAAVPKKQVTAGKRARTAARRGEKYTTALRGQLAPGADPDPRGPGEAAAHPPDLEHRRLIGRPADFRPFRNTGLFERIGGQSAISRLVDLLYEGIEVDEQLRPLFARDLSHGRAMQKLFFGEWLGGPRLYSEQSHAGLRHRHDGLAITPALASRWLGHFRRAVEATVGDEGDRRAVLAQARTLSRVLVSQQVAPAAPPGRGRRTGQATPPGRVRQAGRPARKTAHGRWPGAGPARAACSRPGMRPAVVTALA